ncbi:MAG: DoxX family protein [Bacteroidetes bacterium]|nr:DoxX family protein [Bacteroidota bacterium]MDA0985390.1 DoxX family protein [Bacteroidota bacterium]
MKTASINFGLLLLRVGFSVGLMTHGYGKFMKVIQGNFEFGDPIGIGPTFSLILASIGEFIAPILILLGWKTRIASLFPIITMLVAFAIAHDGDPFSTKEKSFVYLIAFLTLYFTGPGKYALGKE